MQMIKVFLQYEGNARRAMQGKVSLSMMTFCFEDINYAYHEHPRGRGYCKSSTLDGEGGILAGTRLFNYLKNGFIGHEQRKMLKTLFAVVRFAKSTNANRKTLASILHCRFQNTHGRISQ